MAFLKAPLNSALPAWSPALADCDILLGEKIPFKLVKNSVYYSLEGVRCPLITDEEEGFLRLDILL
jgi:hypothetical protein